MKLFTNSLVLRKINRYLHKNVKDQSPNILRLWATQCEFVFAQQLRRSQQIFTLYAKIWEERALRELLKRFRGQVQRHAKGFLLSSATLLAFDWDRERIEFEQVKDYFDDFNFLERLQKETIFCPRCQKRKEIDCRVEGVRYCSCPRNDTEKPPKEQNEFTAWEPYIEQKDMITWRKEVKSGLYAYKVFVEYPDITAEDFLHVQTDVEYRKKWDNTAVSLEVIDEDTAKGSNSHIIYWEMLWPKLFANRDYVYNRRYFVDRSKKVILIVNKSVQHPKCPAKPTNQRVNEYWSFMVIKPTSSFNKPGVSFILTYFDNPGLSIPKYITNWVARKQMPDFLSQLHKATLNYAAAKKHNETRIVEFWDKYRDPGFEYPPDTLTGFTNEDYLQAQNKNEERTSLQAANPQSHLKTEVDEEPMTQRSDATKSGEIQKTSQASSQLASTTITTATTTATISTEDCGGTPKTSWWAYLYSYLYFV
ncbi:stAR-related lipid transfer protein 7, mitochondrial-like isoform X1 [Toxorhynchites rutilus septentrionalis]|uniref:stAR-related lipid transfer protein 7, mitochondrial-like isoform X1 n=1 Tax=Toxorhynchites rutilus septentrionalis TaxID=329112 RepID=UPI00247A6B0A|nr:stAR-related lipid transfer protein 7, mitochondrial-like isoform X1 [Toxorhynchites rutilus septentrionalis]